MALTPFILRLQSLVACLGGAFIGGIVDRMAKDFRHCRAGLPDLVVLNSSNSSYKVRSRELAALNKLFTFFCEFKALHDLNNQECHVVAAGGGEGAQ